jgi:hypothetical protein
MASRIALVRAGLVLVPILSAGLLADQAAARPKPDVRQLPMNTLANWVQVKPGRVTVFRTGGLTITLGGLANQRVLPEFDEVRAPSVRVYGPDGKVFAMRGEDGGAVARASIAVTRLDPASPYPQVVFSSNSMGPHCCERTWVLDYVGGRWTAIDLGAHQAEQEVMPRDEDGDGRREFVFADEGYWSAFSGFVSSHPPVRVYRVEGGRLLDVSAERRYRKVHLYMVEESRDGCVAGSNGHCAGFVASAARAGRFAWAWKTMLAHYDRSDDWYNHVNLGACYRRAPNRDCAEKDRVRFPDYPTALRWYLGRTGYLPPVPLPPRLTANP